jgi:hypothetical protein
VFGELLVEERDRDEVVAVLVGDATGEVVCPEFEFPFSAVQPRIKASHKQPTKAKVKRCFLRFCTRILLLFRSEHKHNPKAGTADQAS